MERYQVALSFARAERPYVEAVARALQARGIAVFYDGFERVQLWGAHGSEVFEEVFARGSGYVIMFISKDYVERAWPIHERRAALSRAVQESREYILPVRFDDTPVPGLPSDVLYERAAEHTPAGLAAMIAEKVGVPRFSGKAHQVPPPRMTSPTGEAALDYGSYNGSYVIGTGILRNTAGFYAALHVTGIKDDSRDHPEDELRFRYAIQADGSDSFAEFEGL